MNDCLFCKIINGEIPSYTIYENDLVKVFLDINPSTNGDSLIIPKKHFNTIEDIEIDTLKELDKVKQIIYPLLKQKLNCEGLTFVQNNDLGQDIKHFHIHATPRYKNDLISHDFNKETLKNIEQTFETINKKDFI